MRRIAFTIVSTLIIQIAQCQNPCLPYGIGFSSQEEIDSFTINYPDCTEIEGNVWIGSEEPTDISNLNGLSEITAFGGSLTIMTNPYLTSLSGLENLSAINGSLLIALNDSLKDISALSNLTEVGGSFDFHGNNQMIKLEGLNSLGSIGSNVWVSGNKRLASFSGLSGLNSIGGYLWIGFNDSLTSLEGLQNIDPQSIESLSIAGNPFLSFCHVESICNYIANPVGSIEIVGNASGCDSIEEVEESCMVGIESQIEASCLTVYPNPSNQDFITVIIGKIYDNLSLHCVNFLGQEVYKQVVFGKGIKIDISSWQPGIYLLIIEHDQKLVGRTKIIIQ
jgi:hypothetical protein